jgi:hypothetical protein
VEHIAHEKGTTMETEPTTWEPCKTPVAFIVWVASLLILVLTIRHPWAYGTAAYFAGGANAVLAMRIWRWVGREH